ncbi:MAG: TolC family protein [Pirellulales bacterium]
MTGLHPPPSFHRGLLLVCFLAGCRSEGRLDWLARDARATVAPHGQQANWERPGTSPRDAKTAAPPAPASAEVRQVSFQAEERPREAAPELVPAPPATPEGPRPVLELEQPPVDPAERTALPLRQVIESVYYSFPALEVALREFDIAGGKQLAAWGEFDLKIKAESMSQPLGYYENYRNVVKLEQALMSGGAVFGQYRIGDGDFPVYYGERETNEGGEFKVGWETPLLRGRAIDERRANIFQATLKRQQVDPAAQALLLEFTFGASDAYWSWVAAGLSYDAQRELLRVTVERNEQFEERVKREDLAPIELVQNERLIASREAKVIEAERKLQQAAIKLSLYLRDEQGRPVMPTPAMLPDAFPEPLAPERNEFPAEVAQALANRPELTEIDLQRQQAEVDLALGENLRLPALNAVLLASKDVGASPYSKKVFSPFDVEAGVWFEVPLQRRKADGKIQEAYGKLAQLAAKREFLANKITIQVQDAQSALATSFDRVSRARRNVVLARRLEAAERQRFDAEDSDLLRVAIQESAEIEATLLEIDALADYFKAAAALRAALALDPLGPDPLALEPPPDPAD